MSNEKELPKEPVEKYDVLYVAKDLLYIEKEFAKSAVETYDALLRHIEALNGDKPILEYVEDRFLAHGTPWRGKESWGMRASAPLCGLCFLEQAKENSIRKLTPSEVSSRLFGQILLPESEEGVVATLELADKLITNTPAYLLKCDISREATKLSFEAMTGLSFEEREQTL